MSTSPWSLHLRSILWTTNLITIVIGAWWTFSLSREDLLKLLRVSLLRTLSGPLLGGGPVTWPLIPSREVLLCWLPCKILLSTIPHASSVSGVAFNPFLKKWNCAMSIPGLTAFWIVWLALGRGAQGLWTLWRHVLCIQIIHMPSVLKNTFTELLTMLFTSKKRGTRLWASLTPQRKKVIREFKCEENEIWRFHHVALGNLALFTFSLLNSVLSINKGDIV